MHSSVFTCQAPEHKNALQTETGNPANVDHVQAHVERGMNHIGVTVEDGTIADHFSDDYNEHEHLDQVKDQVGDAIQS